MPLTWVLLALITIDAGQPAWVVVRRFEHRGGCQQWQLAYPAVTSCAWDPAGIIQ